MNGYTGRTGDNPMRPWPVVHGLRVMNAQDRQLIRYARFLVALMSASDFESWPDGPKSSRPERKLVKLMSRDTRSERLIIVMKLVS